jgi:hypothetical protein
VITKIAAVHKHLLQMSGSSHAVFDGSGHNIFAVCKLVPGEINDNCEIKPRV